MNNQTSINTRVINVKGALSRLLSRNQLSAGSLIYHNCLRCFKQTAECVLAIRFGNRVPVGETEEMIDRKS